MPSEVVVAAVSFLAAVFAVVVGQLLGGFVERRAEERRWARSERDRHRTAGEKAAEAVLDAIIEVDLGPFSFWKGRRPEPTDAELEPYVTRIQRHGLVIEDATAREAARLTAVALFQNDTLAMLREERSIVIWKSIRSEAESVLGAYLRGEPVPRPTALVAMEVEVKKYFVDRYGLDVED